MPNQTGSSCAPASSCGSKRFAVLIPTAKPTPTEHYGRHAFRQIDFEQRHIVAAVGAQHRRLKLFAGAEAHAHRPCIFHHMIIRQDQATWINDKSGATAKGLGAMLRLAQCLNLHDASTNFGEDRTRYIRCCRRGGANWLRRTVGRRS